MPEDKIIQDIEKAFDYRGHVTLHLSNGDRVEGFVYNRQFAPTPSKPQPFVDIFLKSDGSPQRFPLENIQAVEFTGKDHADHESYDAWKKRREEEKKTKAS